MEGIRWAIAPVPHQFRDRRVRFWFCLTLVYAVIVAALMVNKVTAQPYTVPDDARQHIFWMQRFVDPDLFPQDWIADYFQSVSPLGVQAVYRGLANLGIPPWTANSLLAAGLGVLTAITTFLVAWELCALPAAGFAAAVMLQQSIDFTANVASATPKAFVFWVFLGFLYGWLRRSRWLIGGFIALQGLFNPQVVLVSAGVLILGLVERRPGGRWQGQRDRTLWQVSSLGLGIAAIVIAQYALASSAFGPTVTLEQALAMPEFFPGGRNAFFQPDPWDYVLQGRSGLRIASAFTPLTTLLALALPFLPRCPKTLPLAPSLQPTVGILWKIVVVALFCFWAAHVLLFRLHLPSRYTGRFFLTTAVLAAGIALVILIDGLLQWALVGSVPRSPQLRGVLGGGTALALAGILVLYPLTYGNYPKMSLERGRAAALYEFFATQPKDSLIAGLVPEVDNLPTFSYRSVLVGAETAISYHQGFYQEIQARARSLITAQYSPDLSVLQAFIQNYGITHWVLEANSFTPEALQGNRWIMQYQPEADRAIVSLLAGETPALALLRDRCLLFHSEPYTVLDAACLQQADTDTQSETRI